MAPSQGQRLVESDHSDEEEAEDGDVEANLCCPHPLSNVLSCLPCVWPCWLLGFQVINPNEHASVITWGQYVGSITTPGLRIVNPVGVTLRKISTARQAMDIKDLKCSDGRGNPIFVSGNVNYRLCSAKKATVDIGDMQRYISDQAPMVLRRVCSRFPYDAPTGACLRGHNGEQEDNTVSEALRATLQQHLREAGVEVFRFDLTDLSYAPEIAGAMLQKQQAEAMLEARELVVRSAVQISSDAIRQMKELGHAVSPAAEERIISNLLTVICSDRGAQPTVPLA